MRVFSFQFPDFVSTFRRKGRYFLSPAPYSLLPITYYLLHFTFYILPFTSARADRQFLWEQANTQAAAAVTPEDYAKAADTYARLIADGAVNADVFANLGSARVLAGDGAGGAEAFERAERYRGSSPETRQGLLAAHAKRTGRAQADMPWSRTAFFWHYSLPCRARVLVMLSGWSLFWAGVLVRLLSKHRKRHGALHSLSETGMLIGGLMTLVFAVSVAVTMLQEFIR